jgi:hypothetical protein
VPHLHPPRSRNTPDDLLLLIDANQSMIWIQICQGVDEIMKGILDTNETEVMTRTSLNTTVMVDNGIRITIAETRNTLIVI